MPIPKTRDELVQSVQESFARLDETVVAAGPRAGSLPCVDEWSIKDLLAVRAWWTHQVIDWIEAGVRDEAIVLPAKGFTWRETPRLNSSIVKRCQRKSYRSVLAELRTGFARILPTVESLSDRELLQTGQYEWAGSHPLARWISINTVRQYTTARTMIRKTLKQQT